MNRILKLTSAFLVGLCLTSDLGAQTIQPGGGGGGGSGTVTSIATGCGATGGTITTTGTISTQQSANAQTSAGYTLASTDCGKLVTVSNASAQTLTLNNFSTGNYTRALNIGVGTWTISASSGSINGCTSLPQNWSADIQFDGTNWNVACRMGSTADGVTTTIVGANFNSTELHPGYIANTWYMPPTAVAGIGNGSALTSNNIYCIYAPFPLRVTIGSLNADVTTLSAGGHFGMAIYSNFVSSGNPQGVPGALIDFVSPLSTASTANVNGALQSNRQLGPGGTAGSRDVWFCLSQDNSTSAVSSLQGTSYTGAIYIGQSAINNLYNQPLPVLFCSTCESSPTWSGGAFTWPANLNTSTWTQAHNTATAPAIAFEVVSEP